MHDIARCVMAPGELRPYILSAKAAAVRDIKKSRGFGSLVAAFKRINNILRQSADKNIEIPGEVDMSALKDESEIKLGKVYSGLSEDIKGKLKEDDYKAVLKTLSSIRDDVDSFFEKVLVMDPDENVMKNRLALLKNIVELFAPVGDISSLEMK